MNESQLKFNKSTAHIHIRADKEIDLTAVRIGKQRLARKKDSKPSALKSAIVEFRNHNSAPTVAESEDIVTEETVPDAGVGGPSSGSYLPYPPSPELDELLMGVLKELCRLQARGKDQPPEKKYKYKKFVVGFREVQRALSRGELKGVVVATNLEDAPELEGLITNLSRDCAAREVPLLFALTRRKMGKALGKSMKQSLVGIVNLDGVHQPWKQALASTETTRFI
jgi:selenocysteine insertion sequence-binding protein 2